MKVLRNILWFFAVINIISMICFAVYRHSYAIPTIWEMFCLYASFALTPNSILGAVITLALMRYRKTKKYMLEKNHIILLLINLIGVIIGWRMFLFALLMGI